MLCACDSHVRREALKQPASIGQAKKKAPFSGILSNSSGINRLSLARMALFAARAVWFVVSVPIFLASVLGWSPTLIGGFMAVWVIGYGGVQGLAPVLLARVTGGRAPGPALAATLGLGLAATTALIPIVLRLNVPPAVVMLGDQVRMNRGIQREHEPKYSQTAGSVARRATPR